MAELEQVQQLLAQLATAREEFRREVAAHTVEREKLEKRKKQTARLQAAARAEKLRTREVYRRFLRHMKRKWAAERQAVDAERQMLQRERTDLERRESEAEAYNERLQHSWNHLNESQRRFLVERQQAEQWFAQQNDTVQHRAETVSQHEKQFAATRDELEQQLQTLKDEIKGLDARASNARHTIEQLELKQSRLLVPADGYVDSISAGLVPLSAPAGAPVVAADDLLDDLHTRQQDLDRVRRKIFAARDELDRQTTSLDDQRAILGEQVASLVAARELWSAAERDTLAEMETMARALRGAERALELREQQLIEAEKLSRERESDLWSLREQLEAWRRTLAAHEAATLAARDQQWAALETERKRHEWREGSLAEIAASWSEIRAKEREHYLAVVEQLEAERRTGDSARVAWDQDRQHFAGELVQVASMRLALEERAADGTPAAQRKLRILTAHWEKHFRRWESRVTGERVACEKASAKVRELESGLNDTMARWFDQRAAALDAKLERDRERLREELAAMNEAVSLQLPERLEREQERLSGEIERLAEMIGGPREAEPGVPAEQLALQ